MSDSRTISDRHSAMPIEAKPLNRALKRVRKWANKAKDGSTREKHTHARELWRAVKRSGCKTDCCGKKLGKWCKKCPRYEPDLMRRVMMQVDEHR